MNELQAVINLAPLIFSALKTMLESGAMEIRDVDKGGGEPFLYASGWRGLGYVLIKALVSHPFFPGLVMLLATKVATIAPRTTFVAGNLTGGVIPGWLLSRYLENLLGHPVHFMYVAGTRTYEEALRRPVMLVDKITMERIAQNIASSVAQDIGDKIDFVAGGAPRGMILGHRISEILSLFFSRHVPFVYVRDIKKSGGHGEMITGTQNNPFFKPGMTALVVGPYPEDRTNDGTGHVMKVMQEAGFQTVTYHDTGDDQLSEFQAHFFEGLYRPLMARDKALGNENAEGLVAEELTNFTKSSRVSAKVLEDKYDLHVPYIACLLSYDQPEANRLLHMEGLDLISLFTLRNMLWVAKQIGSHPGKLIKGYRQYLADPIGWNKQRGFEQVEKGGTL